MTEPSSRAAQLLDAALHVVAEHGLRGLTHRAVDRAGGAARGQLLGVPAHPQAPCRRALTEYVAGTLADDVDRLAEDLRALPAG